jgi:DNA (cytosine-5)-methyltransferase 1
MKSANPNSGFYEADTSRTIDGNGGNPGCNQGCIAVIEGNGTRPSHKGDGYKESDVMYTLNATEQHAVAFADIHATLSANDGPKGPSSQMMGNPHENFVGEPAYGIGRPAMNQGYNAKFSFQIEEEVEPTIVAAGASGVAHPVCSSSKASFFTSAEEEMANTLVATDYKDPPIVNEPRYIVRRLTPTECARLQGFPDWWCDELGTENPTDEDISIWREIFQTHTDALGKKTKPKTDNQIRKWLKNPHSDSAEYKMWGNGVALPNVVFVLSGIAYYAQNHDG